jgi:RimJ/RimL family protein N-acetyltransferase
MAEIVAETARLVLRREAPGDLATWFEHMNTPEVTRRIGGVQSPAKVAEAFAKMAAVDPPLTFLFVELKRDGTLLGKCGLAPIETAAAPAELRGQVQIGWTLRADHWGRGYAREAAEAMIALAFGPAGLPTVFAQTSDSNGPSWRLMERLGMRRFAELDYPDPDYPAEDNPTIVYRLDIADWRARAAAARSRAHA